MLGNCGGPSLKNCMGVVDTCTADGDDLGLCNCRGNSLGVGLRNCGGVILGFCGVETL